MIITHGAPTAYPWSLPGGWRRLWRELFRGNIHRANTDKRPWAAWRHVTKLDPDRELADKTLNTVWESGTDAIIIGGTQGITAAKVLALLRRIENGPKPVILEVSNSQAAVPGVCHYLIPHVLNSAGNRWLMGHQADVVADLLPRFGKLIPWERMWPAAYIIQNPDSAAAKLAEAVPLPAAAVAAHAALIGRLWRLPLLYIEYSGRYGDPNLVAAARKAAGPTCRVWYGGGISGAGGAMAMAKAADTIVVGNLIYTEPERLKETVAAARL